MRITFIDLIRAAYKKKDEKFRKKLFIFLACLLISVIIWFTIKMSAEYDTVVEMPVTFTHMPQNKVLTFVSDTTLQVEILERGSNLFRMLYLKNTQPVSVSLRFLPLNPKGGVYQGLITPALLINEIEREQNLLGKIISISPDTIYLSFEPEKSRKLAVNADFDLTFEKQFMKYGAVMFSPESVMVRGPENIVGNMENASLGEINLKLLDQDHTGDKMFPKDSINQLLTYTPNTVTYTIPVEKYTEAEAEIPVRVVSSQGLKAKTFPDKVKIYYTVALKDYNLVEPEMIQAVADLSSINLVSNDRIKVGLENYPSYIHINKIVPEKVEFIIIK